MSSDSNELYYAEMEAARNSACDAYFEARPQIDRPDRRAAFNSGFERAFALVWHGGRAAQETPAEDDGARRERLGLCLAETSDGRDMKRCSAFPECLCGGPTANR